MKICPKPNENIWFISDTHFNHANVIKYDDRPFSSIEEHDSVIISNWNDYVKPKETVFFLGDFCFGGQKKVKEVLDQLNGNIFFIKGNHERPLCAYLKSVGGQWYDYLEIKIRDEELERKYQDICLFHYPIYEWNKGHYGSWMLHGHCHHNCKWSNTSQGKIMDVGVNGLNFKPISYKELKQDMSKKSIITHH